MKLSEAQIAGSVERVMRAVRYAPSGWGADAEEQLTALVSDLREAVKALEDLVQAGDWVVDPGLGRGDWNKYATALAERVEIARTALAGRGRVAK